MITLDALKNMQRGDCISVPRPGKSPERWRVNGAVKTWKRDPSRVRVPIKFGLYRYSSVSEADIDTLNNWGATIERY